MLALAWGWAALAGNPVPPPPTPPGIGAAPPDLREVAAEVRDQPLADRVGAISAALLGRPYVNDPMGEVRQVMTGRMVALGCCGWAGGAYERSCALAGPMRECLDQWTTACTEASRSAPTRNP